MDTNETSAGEFYYFHGAMGTKHPQNETFSTLTEALDFAAVWVEERLRPPSDAAFWQIEYVRDTTGVVMIAHSNPERCKVNDWARGIICAAEGFIGDWYTRLNMMAARRGLLNELINAFGVREATT